MQYKKLQANKIFTGTQMLNQNFVLILSPQGIVQDVVHYTNAGDDIQQLQGILTPGFINCHCHLELSHMKNQIDTNTGLANFILQVVAKRFLNQQQILQAIANAENEMIQNGIVAVADICNTTNTISQKQQNNIYYHNFIEASGWNPQIAQDKYDAIVNVYEQFLQLNTHTSIVPHAPYSVSNKLWQLLQTNFTNKTISIHNQETIAEDELFLHGTGGLVNMYAQMQISNTHFTPTQKTSIQSCYNNMANAKNIVLVHNTFTTQADIDFVKNTTPNVHYCLCPNANLYIENTMPPVNMLVQNNCNIVLGTDSLASNWSLSILSEIKTLHNNFKNILLEQMLQWATLNGAKALQIDNTFGSFEKNKKPGVNLISPTLETITKIV